METLPHGDLEVFIFNNQMFVFWKTLFFILIFAFNKLQNLIISIHIDSVEFYYCNLNLYSIKF